MTRLEFPRHPSGHYFLPVHIYGAAGAVALVSALVDTGASKCTVPRAINEKVLGLPIDGRDENVGTALATQSFDYVTIPKISLAQPEFKTTADGIKVNFLGTDMYGENVQTWLGNRFILGMNFLSRFDITLRRDGRLVLEH